MVSPLCLRKIKTADPDTKSFFNSFEDEMAQWKAKHIAVVDKASLDIKI